MGRSWHSLDSLTEQSTKSDPRGIWDFDLVDTTSYRMSEELKIVSDKTYELACSGTTDFLNSTTKRLSDVEKKTEEAVIRYYSRQMEEISASIREYQTED